MMTKIYEKANFQSGVNITYGSSKNDNLHLAMLASEKKVFMPLILFLVAAIHGVYECTRFQL